MASLTLIDTIHISSLHMYPVKSAAGIYLEEATIEHMGIPYDRSFAVLSSKDKIITAREKPGLLSIRTRLTTEGLLLSAPDMEDILIDWIGGDKPQPRLVTIFKDPVSAIIMQHPVNDWLSSFLGQSVSLIRLDMTDLRKMKAKFNAQENDVIGFQDGAAIHLISEESVKDLESRGTIKLTNQNFRPNIVVRGLSPYAEEQWQSIKIGDCEFDVAVKTARCPMITIDPHSYQRDAHQEPLRTLSQYNTENHCANFGIYLIPRKLGVIKVGDVLEVLR